MWVGGVAALIAVYTLMSGGDEGPTLATTSKRGTKGSSAKDNPYDTPIDHEAKFAPVALAAADVFNPLVKKPITATITNIPPTTGPIAVPASLTGGESGWYYTGLAELDGVRQGLLENSATGESAYVGVGDDWKAARIVKIDAGVIEMTGPNGGDFTVPILAYGDAPGVAAPRPLPLAQGGNPAQPLNVPGGALNGQIGGNGLGLRPMNGAQAVVPPNGQGLEAPLQGTTNDPNNSAGGNRRGRRNRNNNQGNLGVNNVP